MVCQPSSILGQVENQCHLGVREGSSPVHPFECGQEAFRRLREMMPQAVRAPNISPTGGEAPRRNRFVYGRLEGLTRRAPTRRSNFWNRNSMATPSSSHLVKSNRAQVVHRNSKVFLCAPSFMRKTACGWNYYNSDYEFSIEDGTKLSCQKCITSAQTQGGWMCRWLLGQWICHWPDSFVPRLNQQAQTGCSTDHSNRCKLWGGRLDHSSSISGSGCPAWK